MFAMAHLITSGGVARQGQWFALSVRVVRTDSQKDTEALHTRECGLWAGFGICT
jgi:hypothetical protein